MRINVAHLKLSSENTWLVCVLAYIKTTTDVDQRNESEKITAKRIQLMAVAIIAASVVTVATIIGIINAKTYKKQWCREVTR